MYAGRVRGQPPRPFTTEYKSRRKIQPPIRMALDPRDHINDDERPPRDLREDLNNSTSDLSYEQAMAAAHRTFAGLTTNKIPTITKKYEPDEQPRVDMSAFLRPKQADLARRFQQQQPPRAVMGFGSAFAGAAQAEQPFSPARLKAESFFKIPSAPPPDEQPDDAGLMPEPVSPVERRILPDLSQLPEPAPIELPVEEPKPRRVGRPLGSKNKVKTVDTTTQDLSATDASSRISTTELDDLFATSSDRDRSAKTDQPTVQIDQVAARSVDQPVEMANPQSVDASAPDLNSQVVLLGEAISDEAVLAANEVLEQFLGAEPPTLVDEPVQKRRVGRPKGSRNKPKIDASPVAASAELQDAPDEREEIAEHAEPVVESAPKRGRGRPKKTVPNGAAEPIIDDRDQPSLFDDPDDGAQWSPADIKYHDEEPAVRVTRPVSPPQPSTSRILYSAGGRKLIPVADVQASLMRMRSRQIVIVAAPRHEKWKTRRVMRHRKAG